MRAASCTERGLAILLSLHIADLTKRLLMPTTAIGTARDCHRTTLPNFDRHVPQGREELALKEEAELEVIFGDHLRLQAMAETAATTARQMGLVIKAAQAKLAKLRVDGKALSETVKAKLSWTEAPSRLHSRMWLISPPPIS